MRVGILASSLSRGGAERQAALWAAACVRTGHEVEILALHRRPEEYAVPDEVSVHHVEKRGALDLLRVGRAVRALGRRVDVLAAFQPYPALFCAAGRIGAPWLLVTGEDPRRFADTSRVPGAALRAAIRRAPVRVTPTLGLAECHRALGLGEEWEVVPNIVGPEAFAAGSERREGGALWVGRLVPEKDPLLAVAAAHRAQVPLTVLGDGPLRAEVERAGGPGVRLAPFTPDPWPEYRRHRALLLTSRYEAFGNVIVEALAAGTPVVAGDCDFGPREVLAGASGSRLVARDADALAAALRDVVDARGGEAEARKHAGHFRLDAVAPRIAEVVGRAAALPAVSSLRG